MKRNKTIVFSGILMLACFMNVFGKGIPSKNNSLKTGFKRFMTSIRPIGKNRRPLLKGIKTSTIFMEKDNCSSNSGSVVFKNCSLNNSSEEVSLSDTSVPATYDLSNSEICLQSSTYQYTGNSITPTIASVTPNESSSESIPSNKYIVTSSNNVHCGKATITLSGTDNASATSTVTGSKSTDFYITKANLTAPINASATTVNEDEQVNLSVSNYSSPTAGTGKLQNLLRESSQKEEGPTVTWSVLEGEGEFSQNGLTTMFTPSSTGTVKLRADLSNMNDFENYSSDVSIAVHSSGSINLKSDIESVTPHCNIPISAVIPDDLQNVSYQWYLENNPIADATNSTYIPTKSDIGKKLSLTITPNGSSTYNTTTYNIADAVESHSYNNGFCTKCDEHDAAVINEYDTCLIDNGGKLFWLAEQFDAENSTIPQNVRIFIKNDIN